MLQRRDSNRRLQRDAKMKWSHAADRSADLTPCSCPSVRLYMAVLTATGGYIVAYAGNYVMYERLSYSHVHEM